jgi:hypothetical protein
MDEGENSSKGWLYLQTPIPRNVLRSLGEGGGGEGNKWE